MAGKLTGQFEYECASLLKEFDVTEYEAYTFVSLLRFGADTAKDVAEVGDVPRIPSTTRLTPSTRLD